MSSKSTLLPPKKLKQKKAFRKMGVACLSNVGKQTKTLFPKINPIKRDQFKLLKWEWQNKNKNYLQIEFQLRITKKTSFKIFKKREIKVGLIWKERQWHNVVHYNYTITFLLGKNLIKKGCNIYNNRQEDNWVKKK